MHVFFPYFGQKSTKCAQEAVTISTKTKTTQFSPFPVKFFMWVKSEMVAKMATTVNDVIGPQQRQTLSYIPHLVDHITGFLLMVKTFRNIVT